MFFHSYILPIVTFRYNIIYIVSINNVQLNESDKKNNVGNIKYLKMAETSYFYGYITKQKCNLTKSNLRMIGESSKTILMRGNSKHTKKLYFSRFNTNIK